MQGFEVESLLCRREQSEFFAAQGNESDLIQPEPGLLNRPNTDQRRLICTDGGDKGNQNTTDLVVVLDERGDALDCSVDQPLVGLPDLIELDLELIHDVRDLPGNALVRALHEVVELTALAGHILERLLDHREPDAAFGDELLYLGFGNAEELREFLEQRNTRHCKVAQLPGLEFPEGGDLPVVDRDARNRNRDTGGNVAQCLERRHRVLGRHTHCDQLFHVVRDIGNGKRRPRRKVDDLGHHFVRLLFAPEHRLESHSELLDLAAHLYDLPQKRGKGRSAEYLFESPIHFTGLQLGGVPHLLNLPGRLVDLVSKRYDGLSRGHYTSGKFVSHQELYFDGLAHFLAVYS